MKSLVAKLPVFRWHERSIYGSRVDKLVPAIVEIAGSAGSMLDIGCGDGSLARSVAEGVGATDLHGVDVKLRPKCVIDVKAYDGVKLPFEDARFDLVTINDVLHHAGDPEAVVREALRVLKPTGQLVIKDHFRLGPWSNAVLLAMDVVGNYAPGVLVRGHYLSPPEWVELVSRAGGSVERLIWPLVVHALPWRLVARGEYQFLMRVRRSGATEGALRGPSREVAR